MAGVVHEKYLIIIRCRHACHRFFPNLRYFSLSLTRALDFLGIEGSVDRK